ncbi:MAG: thioesterase family protein [Pseudomonadota bacterium]
MTDQPPRAQAKPADAPLPDLRARSTFAHWTSVTIRFCDTDLLGHVNNVAIASYFEAARCAFFYDLLAREGRAGLDFILARVAIDFVAEIHYPGTVEVGTCLTRLGTKSLHSGYGAFIGDTCVATGEAVNVFFDPKTRKTEAPEPALRALLEQQIVR